MTDMKDAVIDPGSVQSTSPGRRVRITFPVGSRYLCTRTVDVEVFLKRWAYPEEYETVQWEPFAPKQLTETETKDYEVADVALAWYVEELARENADTPMRWTPWPGAQAEFIPAGRRTSTSEPGNQLADGDAA
jgi:hypothetical protein